MQNSTGIFLPFGLLFALTFSIASNSVLYSSQNNTVLEQAQKSLEANQNLSGQSSSTNLGDSTKITKLSPSLSKYENRDYGISIEFPSAWKPSEVNLDTYVVVIFYAPETDPNAPDYVFQPAWLLVASQKLASSNITLPQFVQSFFKEYYQNVSAYRIISNLKSNLGGLDAEKIVMYEYLQGSLKVLRSLAIDHSTNTAYWIKYAAEPGLFSKYLPMAEQMIKSFKLLKQ